MSSQKQFYNTVIVGNGVHMPAGMGTQVQQTLTIFAVDTGKLERNTVYDISGLEIGSNQPVNYPRATFTKAIAPAIAEFTIP
ncbi:hypothetical protein [Trinickia fusca]|uniref:Uncharacterized protein n=1 Tax=Trinickia fusca TaxID=2419777 RepID=A0A494XXB9_9BURK|nr:hypothetical protein [Trinickia fusca]RKP52754.1 hypothetical protein D7S89_04545 [Trinickia fusca]